MPFPMLAISSPSEPIVPIPVHAILGLLSNSHQPAYSQLGKRGRWRLIGVFIVLPNAGSLGLQNSKQSKTRAQTSIANHCVLGSCKSGLVSVDPAHDHRIWEWGLWQDRFDSRMGVIEMLPPRIASFLFPPINFAQPIKLHISNSTYPLSGN
jgi:hypothetical protein